MLHSFPVYCIAGFCYGPAHTINKWTQKKKKKEKKPKNTKTEVTECWGGGGGDDYGKFSSYISETVYEI